MITRRNFLAVLSTVQRMRDTLVPEPQPWAQFARDLADTLDDL